MAGHPADRPRGKHSEAAMRTRLLRERLEGVLAPDAVDALLAEAGWDAGVDAPSDPWLRSIDWLRSHLLPRLEHQIGADEARQLLADLRRLMTASGVMRFVVPPSEPPPAPPSPTLGATQPPPAPIGRPAAYVHTRSAETVTALWTAVGAKVDLFASEDGARVVSAVASDAREGLVLLDRRASAGVADTSLPAQAFRDRRVIVWADDRSELDRLARALEGVRECHFVASDAQPRDLAALVSTILGAAR